MADKAIGELVAATQVTSTDLFVLEQNSVAKKLTGQILENWLVALADGHGGIRSIAKTGTSVLVDTYTITYADLTTSTFTVTNGRSITSITWQSSGTAGDGQVHTGTIAYNDGTSSTVVIEDGVKGDTGAQTYVHVRYASHEPTQDSDMYTTPDDWMGIYVGLVADATTLHYTDFNWYQIKGDTGDTGADCEIDTQAVEYQASSSGTVVPSGTWQASVPVVSKGEYLWTRITLNFTDGSTTQFYSVSYYGQDGTGVGDMLKADYDDSNSVFTAGGIPDYVSSQISSAQSTLITGRDSVSAGADTDLLLLYSASDSGNRKQTKSAFLSGVTSDIAAHKPLRVTTPSFSSLPTTFSATGVTADMVVAEAVLSNPAAQTGAWTITTAANSITIAGSISGPTTLTLLLVKPSGDITAS